MRMGRGGGKGRREKKLIWWGYLIAGVVLLGMGLLILDIAPDSSSEYRQRRGTVLAWMCLASGPLMLVYGVSLKLRGKSHG